MLIPLKVDVPMDRRPWVNCALMAVIIVVSLICFKDVELLCRLAGVDLDSTGTSLVSTMVSTEYLPLPVLALTSSLLHAGVLHLLGNMWFLWVFGNAVNYKLGQLGYLGLCKGFYLPTKCLLYAYVHRQSRQNNLLSQFHPSYLIHRECFGRE